MDDSSLIVFYHHGPRSMRDQHCSNLKSQKIQKTFIIIQFFSDKICVLPKYFRKANSDNCGANGLAFLG